MRQIEYDRPKSFGQRPSEMTADELRSFAIRLRLGYAGLYPAPRTRREGVRQSRRIRQPATRVCLRPYRSASAPETRLAHALTMPKLMIKLTATVLSNRPNSLVPTSGTTVRSRPTMPPTNAFISMSSPNCPALALRPKRTAEAPSLTAGFRNSWIQFPESTRHCREWQPAQFEH